MTALFWIKIFAAAALISFVSWLSGTRTSLAGFLTALPLTTMIALAFSQLEWKDSAQTVEYAKSVLVAVPISLLFFVPFLFSERFKLDFWTCFVSGVVMLGAGYFIHSWASTLIK